MVSPPTRACWSHAKRKSLDGEIESLAAGRRSAPHESRVTNSKKPRHAPLGECAPSLLSSAASTMSCVAVSLSSTSRKRPHELSVSQGESAHEEADIDAVVRPIADQLRDTHMSDAHKKKRSKTCGVAAPHDQIDPHRTWRTADIDTLPGLDSIPVLMRPISLDSEHTASVSPQSPLSSRAHSPSPDPSTFTCECSHDNIAGVESAPSSSSLPWSGSVAHTQLECLIAENRRLRSLLAESRSCHARAEMQVRTLQEQIDLRDAQEEMRAINVQRQPRIELCTPLPLPPPLPSATLLTDLSPTTAQIYSPDVSCITILSPRPVHPVERPASAASHLSPGREFAAASRIRTTFSHVGDVEDVHAQLSELTSICTPPPPPPPTPAISTVVDWTHMRPPTAYVPYCYPHGLPHFLRETRRDA